MLDATLSDVQRGECLNVRIQLDNAGRATNNQVYALQFADRIGVATWADIAEATWTQLGAATPLSHSFGLSGVHGDRLTFPTAAANPNDWTVGSWHEGTSVTNAVSLADGDYTELAFMLQTGHAAPGSNYCLRLVNETVGAPLSAYAAYPELAIVSTANDTLRTSKGTLSTLPSGVDDLAYYADAAAYSNHRLDDTAYSEGVTVWTPGIGTRLSDMNYHKFLPRTKVDGSFVYYAWTEADDDYYQIWTARSNLDGTGFSVTQQVASTFESHEPHFEIVGNTVNYVHHATSASGKWGSRL